MTMEAAREIVEGDDEKWAKRLSTDVAHSVDAHRAKKLSVVSAGHNYGATNRRSRQISDVAVGSSSPSSHSRGTAVDAIGDDGDDAFHNDGSSKTPWKMRERRHSELPMRARPRPMSLPGNFVAKLKYSMFLRDEGIQNQVLREEQMENCESPEKAAKSAEAPAGEERTMNGRKRGKKKREKRHCLETTDGGNNDDDEENDDPNLSTVTNMSDVTMDSSSIMKKTPRLKEKMAKFKWNHSKFVKFWKSNQAKAEKT